MSLVSYRTFGHIFLESTCRLIRNSGFEDANLNERIKDFFAEIVPILDSKEFLNFFSSARLRTKSDNRHGSFAGILHGILYGILHGILGG